MIRLIKNGVFTERIAAPCSSESQVALRRYIFAVDIKNVTKSNLGLGSNVQTLGFELGSGF